MLGIQLATLRTAEVKRLQQLARARGQEGLARQLEAELAARAGQPSIPPSPMPAPARARRAPAIAVAGLAAFIGAAVAWGVSLSPTQATGPQAVALTTSGAPPRVAVALTTTALPQPASSPLPVEATAPSAVADNPRRTSRTPRRNPCLDLATAQARLVCGYPSLAIQDRRLKAALERARASGSDVEEDQADWQARSANVHDRLALADRYAQRIAELESQ